LIDASENTSLRQVMKIEEQACGRLRGSHDFAEGAVSLVEKRRPNVDGL